MTWFEVGLKFGLGLLAAVALAGLVIVVVAAVCISCTEREQRRLHRDLYGRRLTRCVKEDGEQE